MPVEPKPPVPRSLSLNTSTSNRLQYLVPNLVEAMFTDFPGDSGQTVRISVAPEKQPVKRTY